MELVALAHHFRSGMSKVKLNKVAVFEPVFYLTANLYAVCWKNPFAASPLSTVILSHIIGKCLYHVVAEVALVVEHCLIVQIVNGECCLCKRQRSNNVGSVTFILAGRFVKYCTFIIGTTGTHAVKCGAIAKHGLKRKSLCKEGQVKINTDIRVKCCYRRSIQTIQVYIAVKRTRITFICFYRAGFCQTVINICRSGIHFIEQLRRAAIAVITNTRNVYTVYNHVRVCKSTHEFEHVDINV